MSMYDFFMENPILAIIFIVIVAVAVLFLIIKAMQTIGMEKVRGYVYKLFVEAEHVFQHMESSGKQKFEYVVQLARSAIPMPFKLFITEKLLRNVIQLWFDLCKDLLDDGKFNGSGKEEE